MDLDLQKTRELYEARVIRNPDGCWDWTGHREPFGYGAFSQWLRGARKGRMLRAHTASWLLTHGPIPKGKVVMHLCHNPSCSRPDHLQLGTQTDNMRSSTVAGRLCKLIPFRDIPELAKRRAAGEMWKDLARPYGCTVQAVRAAVIRYG